MSRSEWTWSQPHEDYYCYELNPATNQYDKIIWGRSEVGPPAARPSPYPAPHSGTTYVPSRNSNQHPSYGYQSNPRTVAAQSGSSSSYTHPSSTDMDIDPASDDEEMNRFESYSQQTRGSEFRSYLDNRYEQIQRPSRYFKKGRIFMMVWQDQGISPQSSFTKVRRFIVVRNKGPHCLCLCIHTYGGQATTKAGIKPEDHAPLVYDGGEVQLHPNEASLIKEKLVAVLEDSTISLSPYSRIDFGKIYTVNSNSRVRTIGRIGSSYLGRLEEYFRAGIGVNEPDEADE